MTPAQNRGYVALTDPEWYRYLLAQPSVAEANFWQPHGNRRFGAIPRGAPFFFKLRAPQRAIAGFGFFERFEIVSARVAWESFGTMNGAPSFDAMVDRVGRLRKDKATFAGEEPIGCIMISAPIFFQERDWVLPPADWPPTGVQQGKTYDLERDEGARVLRQCIDRARASTFEWNVEREPEDSERFGAPATIRPRLGQGLFSFAVRDAYGNACAVTREHSVPVLEAAHIKPYARGGEHRLENGLLLRSDVHRLFDAGYVTVTPDRTFRVSERLRTEWNNGKTYYALNGTKVAAPESGHTPPARELLEWHGDEVFRA